MVMPPLPTLLTQPALNELGYKGPPLWTILFDKSSNKIIFLVGPGLLPEELAAWVVALWARFIVIFINGLLLEGSFSHG